MFDNIQNTRCLIDFDGTVANSLEWCNVALDEMFMGKLTDKHYIEYYKDFGDTFEIIPGCPWKRILTLLCQYLAKEEMVGVQDSSYEFVPVVHLYDIGILSAMLKVAYDAELIEHSSLDNIVYYKNADNILFGVVLDEIASMGHLDAIAKRASADGYASYRILPISGLFAKNDPNMSTMGEPFLYITDVEDEMEHIFENKVIDIMSQRSFDELAIAPVIEFCRQYKQAGGSIVIQSGSNPNIINKILEVLDIAELFDGLYCSPMFELSWNSTSPWAFKTQVIKSAQKAYDDGRRCFVVGDTKGDAFGAYECALPFYLCWRGYPADPSKLTSAEGTLSVSDWSDYSQDKLNDNPLDAFGENIEHMLIFADEVGKGNIEPPILLS